MKKALALIMSAVMVLSTAVMVSAASKTITVNDSGEKDVYFKVLASGIDSGDTVTVSYTVAEKGATGVLDSSSRELTSTDNEKYRILGDNPWTLDSGEYIFDAVVVDNSKYTISSVSDIKNVTDDDLTFRAVVATLSKRSSGGGGGGGGGSGNGGGALVGNYGNASSGTTGSVTSATASKAATTAVSAAVKDAVASGMSSATANVTLKNAGKITPAVFKSIVSAAEKAAKGLNVAVVINADTVVGNVVTARLYIDLDQAAALNATVDTTVDTAANSKMNAAVKNQFSKYFKNDVAIVSFGQKGAFGMDVKVAVKVDLSKLNVGTLKFFNYNTATNAYTELDNTGSFVDANGYVHFATNAGNSVVIADAPLTAK